MGDGNREQRRRDRKTSGRKKQKSMRKSDLEDIAERRTELMSERGEAHTQILSLRTECTKKLRELLRAAGIFEAFSTIETERNSKIAVSQAIISTIDVDLNELVAAEKYIQGKLDKLTKEEPEEESDDDDEEDSLPPVVMIGSD